MAELILVADNEPDIVRFVEINLRLEGFEVITAGDGVAALTAAFEHRPALALLDVMMPGHDGIEVCRRLRADPRTAALPVIMLTAKSMTADKLSGLAAGADDYILKPFDPLELVARIRSTLQRSQDLRDTSPLTGLPGNHRIEAELANRLARREEVAVAYADLNDFKSYNDTYGFLRGDEVLTMTADVLRTALESMPDSDGFIGHVGGDDFVLVCRPRAIQAVCGHAVADFDRRIRDCYDAEHLAADGVEVRDRRGVVHHYPVVTLALGVASTAIRPFTDHREMVTRATEMKAYLKQSDRRSAWAIDHRTR